MKRPPYHKRRSTAESPTNSSGIDEYSNNIGNISIAEDSISELESGGKAASHDQYSHSFGLTTDEALMRLEKYGRNELPEKKTSKWYIFGSLLIEPMPVMIWIAIVIEAVLAKWMDMSILLGIQMTNASIAFYETTQSGNAVAALKASLRPQCHAKRDGGWKTLDASLLVPGDLVLLSTGSAVPADCSINEGSIELDQSALTGESMAVMKYKGDPCMMGSTVARGEVEATVIATGCNTFFGKTASLLQVSRRGAFSLVDEYAQMVIDEQRAEQSAEHVDGHHVSVSGPVHNAMCRGLLALGTHHISGRGFEFYSRSYGRVDSAGH